MKGQRDSIGLIQIHNMKRILSTLILSLFVCAVFAQSTDTELTTQANVIRNETLPAGNTKTRVANMFQALIDSKVNDNEYAFVTASGTDTYTATIAPTITAYTTGMRVWVKFTNANTGACTINFNGLGAKTMKNGDGTDIAAGSFSAGQIVPLGYDGTYFQVLGGSAADLSDYALTSYVDSQDAGKQPLDGDLTSIAALSSTGFLQRTGSNTWGLSDIDNSYWKVTGTSTITGDATLLSEAGEFNDITLGQTGVGTNALGNVNLYGSNELYAYGYRSRSLINLNTGVYQSVTGADSQTTTSGWSFSTFDLSGHHYDHRLNGDTDYNAITTLMSIQKKTLGTTAVTAGMGVAIGFGLETATNLNMGFTTGARISYLWQDPAFAAPYGMYRFDIHAGSRTTPTTILEIDRYGLRYNADYSSNYTTRSLTDKAYVDAKVADAINDGTTTVAPSQNAVFDALALKASRTVRYGMNLSDLTTTLTAGTNKGFIVLPAAFTVTAVYAYVLTAQTSGTVITVDINEAGTTILSTKLTIDNNETGSNTAATAAVISDTAIAAHAQITADIDAATSGAGLLVIIEGYH
jgi:hypothetical protein